MKRKIYLLKRQHNVGPYVTLGEWNSKIDAARMLKKIANSENVPYAGEDVLIIKKTNKICVRYKIIVK